MENGYVSYITDWVFLVLGLVIYFDATRHKIGKIKGQKSFLNITAGGWATVASITYIGVIAIFLYLINRRKLLDKAKTNPVEVSITHRLLVAILLFILPSMLPMFLSDLAPSIPTEFSQ